MKKLLCLTLCLILALTACTACADTARIPMDRGGVINLLLVGTDTYSDDETGRSDSMIVVQLDPHARTIKLASLLRDLYVEIPGKGSNRLNASYAWGGPRLLMKTLEANFGVTVSHYVEVNFERLARLIDAVGGIDLTITEAEMHAANGILRSYNKAMGKLEEDGLITGFDQVHLNGTQAMCYSRIRKIDSDFERTARQRRVLEGVFHRVMSLDYWTLAGVAMGNMDTVTTDLGLFDILGMIPTVLDMRGAEFQTLTIPGPGMYRDETVNGMMVLMPDKDACVEALTDYFSVR